MPKVTVIIPIYNVENWLRKCLNSAVAQTLKDIEVLAINDGSPDLSQEIVDEYVSKYGFVKSYIKENGGQSDARNFGLLHATGEYVVFLDGDDWLDENALETMYNMATERNSDIVICDIEEVYEDGTSVVTTEIDTNISDIQKAYMIAMPGFCDKMFRREFLKNIEFVFPNGVFYEDLAVYPWVASKTNKISYVHKDLYKYRIRSGSTMKQVKNSKRLTDIFTVFDYIDKNMNDTCFNDELEYIYIRHLLHDASLRFLDYKDEDSNILKIADIVRERFPKWRKNKYYKRESLKYKIVCELIYLKKIVWLRKLLKK